MQMIETILDADLKTSRLIENCVQSLNLFLVSVRIKGFPVLSSNFTSFHYSSSLFTRALIYLILNSNQKPPDF